MGKQKTISDALANALDGLLESPDLNLDELDESTRDAIDNARQVLAKYLKGVKK